MPSPSNLARLGLALLTLAALSLLGWALFGPPGVEVKLSAKTWQLDIEVEQWVLESGSDWCDALPADARDISRRLLEKSPGGPRAEHCRYSAPQWRRRWGARAEGTAPAPPRWPQPPLKALAPDELGAERLGKRQARYELQLRASDGRHWSCPTPLRQWQQMSTGGSFRIQVDRQGVADCASLRAP